MIQEIIIPCDELIGLAIQSQIKKEIIFSIPAQIDIRMNFYH